ncbi:hypothetical protein [Candidatus Nitrosotalea okcheonensis]|uniref:Uncharacterized protein n=1 Tax=Candidatus Nitrosotalea okcheonensis TaxID=1903276 RepID=A0A2H1FG26_9ARCH|nr:hypothetical protein [Candidatus Nitrosotalea okcheonensis]SMH71716.1 conserved protein of unknown function [Candidatus Nitrosotalea okcheonensis]
MKVDITCADNYEAQKLASLIYIKDDNEIFISGILEIIENEIVISLKDKSAHSVLFKDKIQAEFFADFIQSVVDDVNKITETKIREDVVEITKE